MCLKLASVGGKKITWKRNSCDSKPDQELLKIQQEAWRSQESQPREGKITHQVGFHKVFTLGYVPCYLSLELVLPIIVI